MKILNQRFQINYQYPVYFTRHLFHEDNPILRDFFGDHAAATSPRKVLVVVDAGMAQHHPHLKNDIAHYLQTVPCIIPAGPSVVLPGGEIVKNEENHFKEILHAIDRYGVDRHSYVIGIGGGSLLDLTGYAAALAHRGIRHIRIPTTVLSQNDSGVGVKNGVNLLGKKNFLGTFSPPLAVFNDLDFLETLDDRNWRSGMAEAVKVSLIKDKGFFGWLEAHADALAQRDMEAMEQLIYRCAALHLQHIASGDPFESGSSRPLDFGHWSAHKLEQLTGFSLYHGEAVAIGIALDALYSQRIGWLTETETTRILSLLKKLQFDLYHPLLENAALLDGLTEFQEHLGGELTIMLLQGIGQGLNTHEMDKGVIHECVTALKESACLKISS